MERVKADADRQHQRCDARLDRQDLPQAVDEEIVVLEQPEHAQADNDANGEDGLAPSLILRGSDEQRDGESIGDDKKNQPQKSPVPRSVEDDTGGQQPKFLQEIIRNCPVDGKDD